jgi:hypothetical protein
MRSWYYGRAPLPSISDPSLFAPHLLTIAGCWDGKNLDNPNHQDHTYDTAMTGGFAPPILAQLRIPFACPSLPMRLSGIRDNSTTKPSGPRTARRHLFGALATARATLLMLITSSAGRETRPRKPWTPPACWTLEVMASHSSCNCRSDERLFCQGLRRRANRWM